MADYGKKKCHECQQYKYMLDSLNPLKNVILRVTTIFIHNGNLISYVNTKSGGWCELCGTLFSDCIYIKDGEYCTLFPYNEITVINCSIKKPLLLHEATIAQTDIGVFILPFDKENLRDLLFLRGIKIKSNPYCWMRSVYYSHDGIFKSSMRNLQQCAFTVFCDDDKNIYLIDGRGDVIEYETLKLTGEKFIDPSPKILSGTTDWQIYANDTVRVKVYGRFSGGYYKGFGELELLSDRARVGRHTKPALRAPDE